MKYLVIVLCSLLVATTASAFNGEIFPLKVKGVEYCSGSSPVKLTTKTSVPLWIRLDNGNFWSVSDSPNFPDCCTFNIFIDQISNGIKSNSIAVLGSVIFEEFGYLQFDGVVKNDKEGRIKKIKGYFAQQDTFQLGCWSSGKLKTGKQL